MAVWLTVVLSAVFAASALADDARAAAVRLAQQTLAGTLSVDEARVRVGDVRAVEWPDAALGCPKKGQSYAQMIVPGYRVRLEVDGQMRDVHVGGGRAVICARETTAKAPKYFQIVARLQELARHDLAERLKVAAKDLTVVRLRPVTWPDTSLGCPDPSRTYAKAETQGFVIEVRHVDKNYLYHSDRERVVFCPR